MQLTAVASVALLTSCGAGVASSGDDSRPALASGSMIVTSTIKGIADAEAAFPARLALTTTDGQSG